MEREDDIKVIAYGIWEQEGCRDGHDCEHWLKAEVIWEQRQRTKAVSQGFSPKKKSKRSGRKP